MMREHPRRRRTDLPGVPRWLTVLSGHTVQSVWLVVISVALLGGAYQAQRTSDRANVAAHQAKAASLVASRAIMAIQRQRREAILGTCRDQNRRHDATVRAVDEVFAQRPKGRRARAARQTTVFLVDALAPRQDCAAVVASALGRRPAPRLSFPSLLNHGITP